VSQHPSLRAGGVGGRHRNVLKRFERIKILGQEGKWDETKSVYNLPKVKSLKIKVKKVKAEGEEKPKVEGAPAATQAQTAQPAAKAGTPKPQAAATPKAAPAKGAPGKTGGK